MCFVALGGREAWRGEMRALRVVSGRRACWGWLEPVPAGIVGAQFAIAPGLEGNGKKKRAGRRVGPGMLSPERFWCRKDIENRGKGQGWQLS